MTIRRRLTAVGTAAALALLGTTAIVSASSGVSASALTDCSTSTGVVVAVDLSHFGGTVLRGCDASPTTGLNLLHNGGFTTAGTAHDGPAFICRIGTAAFNAGTQYPTPSTEPCTATPSAAAYWSYWLAPAGQNTWTYSPLGAQSDVPKAGEVEAWVYGGTDIAGTTGQPGFTPASVRATDPTTSAPGGDPSTTVPGGDPSTTSPGGDPTTTTPSDPTSTPSGPTAADRAKLGTYLSGQLTDGSYVGDPGSRNYNLTTDFGIALAAAGNHDAALTKTVSYLKGHVTDYAYPDGTSGSPNFYALANLALLAEVVGTDPHSFGGRDLLAGLTDFGAADPGHQALALLALTRGGVTPPAAAVTRLTGMQCADGGFSATAIDAGDPCNSDPSITALTVLALTKIGGVDLTKATDYLLAQVGSDGGVEAYPGAGTSDTITTSEVAQALQVLGKTQPAAATQAWLAARQSSDGGLSGDSTDGGSDLYASALAAPAASGQPLTTLSHPVAADPDPISSAPTGGTPTGPGGVSPDLVKGSAYLVKQLTGGHYYEGFAGSGFADYGLTMDGAFALAATGQDNPALATLVTFINSQAKDSTGQSINDYTGIDTPYVGGGYLGKEALLAELTGYNPRSFAGHDVIAALAATVCADDTSTPEKSCAGKGNYANSASVFSQALGVIAQLRAGDTAQAADPIAFLAGLQNTSGAWPSLIPNSGDSDVDSTGMAAMALALVPGQQAAVAKALTWLASVQLPDGGFPGTAGDSTNSAALAIQGLRLDPTTYAAQIAKARAFLAGQQNTDGGFFVSTDTHDNGSDVRASTQSVGGSVGTSFGTLFIDLPSITAADKGSAFLVSQLTDGNHLTSPYGPDYGLSADLAFALAASNNEDAALAKVTGYLRAHVADYADPAGTGQFPGPYSGALAKLALLAEVTGQNPHSFGGFDLLKVLADNVCTAPESTATFCTAAGDFTQSYSTVSQALGVLALARAGETPPAAAVARLEELQCADGGFSATLITAGATCTSEVDTTSYAVQALQLVPSAAAAVDAGRNFLLDAQQTDGGYLGAAGENSNSTGLAAQALLAIGSTGPVPVRAAKISPRKVSPRAVPAGTDPIKAAKAFLVGLQAANGGFAISTTQPGADVRSTTQAVPALAGATLISLADPVTPIAPGAPVTPPSSTPPGSSAPVGTASPTATAGSTAPTATDSGQAAGGSLASTGAAPLRPVLLALLMILAGTAAMLLARRRRPVQPAAIRLVAKGRKH